MSQEFEEIGSQMSPEVQELAKQARALIYEVMPDAVEVCYPKQNICSYGVGPKKMSEHFCYIGMFARHINLGFYYGGSLPDPDRLLEGTGEMMRHIKVNKAEQLEDRALRQLVEAASGYLPKLKPNR